MSGWAGIKQIFLADSARFGDCWPLQWDPWPGLALNTSGSCALLTCGSEYAFEDCSKILLRCICGNLGSVQHLPFSGRVLVLPGGDFSSVTRQLVMAPPSLTLVAGQDTCCNPQNGWGQPSCVTWLVLLMAEELDGAPCVPSCAGFGWDGVQSQCWANVRAKACTDLCFFREMCKSWLQN